MEYSRIARPVTNMMALITPETTKAIGVLYFQTRSHKA